MQVSGLSPLRRLLGNIMGGVNKSVREGSDIRVLLGKVFWVKRTNSGILILPSRLSMWYSEKRMGPLPGSKLLLHILAILGKTLPNLHILLC